MIKSWTALLSLVSAVSAERFVLHNLYQNGELPYFENEHGHRFMHDRALQGGNEEGAAQGGLIETGTRLDINQTSNTCSTTAFDITCNVASRVSATDGNFSSLSMTVVCALESQNAFDFRFAKNCACGVEARDPSGRLKNCFCEVCPAGFGENPISIECTDDYIIGTCTSLDCDFACNGTCSFDCENSGPDCRFCEDNPFAPTVAPTGPDEVGQNRRPTLIQNSGAADLGYQALWGTVVTVGVYMLVA